MWIAFKIYVIFEIQNNCAGKYQAFNEVVNRFQNLCYLWDTKQLNYYFSYFIRCCESLSKFMLSLRYKTTFLINKNCLAWLWIAFKIYVIFEIQNNPFSKVLLCISVVNRFQNLCYLWDTKQQKLIKKQDNICCESLSKFMLSLRYKTTWSCSFKV